MRDINIKKKIKKYIDDYKNDEQSVMIDKENQNKLNSEIKKIIKYKDKLKPINTSKLLNEDK